MKKPRYDMWTPDQDTIVVNVVLKHIREGSTQLNAFEEVAERLHRTAAGVGFRWNSALRHLNTTAINKAKKERRENKKLGNNVKRKEKKAKEIEKRHPGYEVKPNEVKIEPNMMTISFNQDTDLCVTNPRIKEITQVRTFNVQMTLEEMVALLNVKKLPQELTNLVQDVQKEVSKLG